MRRALAMAVSGILGVIAVAVVIAWTWTAPARRAGAAAAVESTSDVVTPRRPRNRVRPVEPAPRNVKLSRTGFFNGEPTIAVNPLDPDNLVAAWMHTGTPRTMEIMVTASIDGGASWSTPVPIAHVDPAYHASADVSAVFDGYGTAHLTFIDMDADPASDPRKGEFSIRSGEVVHMRSRDGGFTWSKPVRVRHSSETPDFAIDRPWIAVDRSGGPRDGWLYVVTISFFGDTSHGPPQHVHLKRSEDHGTTWGPDVRVDDTKFGTGPLPGVPFPAVVGVGGDGALWIVYPSVGSDACPGRVCLLAAVSRDGGLTFTHSRVSDVNPASRRGYILFQTLAADPVRPGRCSVAWPDGRFDPDGSDLLFVHTTDGGATWSAPERINDNPLGLGVGVDQPWAAAGPNGSLAIVWRDRRAAGTGLDVPFEIYAAVSPDGGDHFLPNRKLSDQPSPYDRVPCCNSFLGLALDGNRLHAAWGDFRDGLWNIYYARAPAGPGQ
ncbi:MAG: exo-alpha-sialidase [Acidobacteria bacterium]|nr:exo-alpha-sialidase [Acidobacteriota bacterium]